MDAVWDGLGRMQELQQGSNSSEVSLKIKENLKQLEMTELIVNAAVDKRLSYSPRAVGREP